MYAFNKPSGNAKPMGGLSAYVAQMEKALDTGNKTVIQVFESIESKKKIIAGLLTLSPEDQEIKALWNARHSP
jgi:hypothetical protein